MTAKAFDVSAFCGDWPFRMLHNRNLEDVLRVHRDNRILSGVLSPLQSVCYNDPFECDRPFLCVARRHGYAGAVSINPTLPAYEADVAQAANLGAKVVRAYPCVHGYDYEHPDFLALGRLCGQLGMILQVFARMDDERLTYLLHPSNPSFAVTQRFLAGFDLCPVIWSNAVGGEIIGNARLIEQNPRMHVDTSGLKDSLFAAEKLLGALEHKKVLYGSLFPLWCLSSTILHFRRAKVPEGTLTDILYGNAKALGLAE